MQTNMGEQMMKELADLVLTDHFLDNYKPSWLNGLEMDRYYPSLRCAFEFQGDQHLHYTFSLYDSHSAFLTQIQNDEKKKKILAQKNIHLIEITADELTPSLFYSKLASLTFSDEVPVIPSSLHTRIQRYQSGMPIHYKKEAKSYMTTTLYPAFRNIPYLEQAIHEYFHVGTSLTRQEKLILCMLACFSKQDEVQFTVPQLTQLFPGIPFDAAIVSLQEKRLLGVHPRFQIMKIRHDIALKTLDFIEKTITFIESKGIKLR